MTVSISATATAATETFATTLTNANLTIPSGATCLAVWAVWAYGTVVPSGITMTWDSGGTNQAMTLVADANSGVTGLNTGAQAQVWGLLAPTIGLKTLSCSWTTTANLVLDAASFTGTATDTLANAFTNPNTSSGATGTTGTVVATGATGNINLAATGMRGANVSSLAATGSTSVFVNNTGQGTAGSRAPSAASLTWTATFASSPFSWALCCVDVSVPANAAQNPYQPWYQCGPILAQ